MKKSSLVALALVVASAAVSAQTTSSNVSTSSLGQAYRSLKEGPLDLSFNLSAESMRDSKTNDVNGVLHTDMAYLGYRLSPNDYLKLENRVVTTNRENVDSVSSWARTVLSYKRSNILTEKEYGVGLSGVIEKRYIPDDQARVNGNTYGLNRVSLTATKNIGAFSFANTLYYALFDVRNKAKLSTTRSYVYGILTQAINLPADFSFSLTEEIIREQNAANSDEGRNVTITAEVGKQFNPDIYLGVTLAGTPIDATTTAWSTTPNWTNAFTYGMNLSITAF